MLFIIAFVLTLASSACFGPPKTDNSEILEKYIGKAEVFLDDGQVDSCQAYIDKCYELDREYPPAHYLEGKLFLYKDGIYNRRLSANSLRKAVLMEEDNSEYHFTLGVTLEKQGYFQNALHEYKKAAELDTTDFRPLERIAEINKRIGLRYDDKKYFERSLEASEKAASLSADPEFYYQQAVALYQIKDYKSSIKVLSEAESLFNDTTDISKYYLLRGTDFVQVGNFDSAYVAFEKARSKMSDLAKSEMDDLRYVLSTDEYMKYQDESMYNQNRMKKQIWGQLDPNPTTEINERLLEHYARFVHAQLTFSVPDKDIEGWRTKRGEMYIRYGSPTSADYILGAGGDAGDSPRWVWRYDQFDEPITLIFEDTFLNGDFDFPYPNKNWTAADYENDPSRLAAMLRSNVPQNFAFNPGTGPLDFYYMPRQFKGRAGKTDLDVYITAAYPQLDFKRAGEYADAAVEWRQVFRYGNWRVADSAYVSRTYRVRASQTDNPNLSVADRLSLSAYPDSLLFSISLRDKISGHIGIDSRGIKLRDFYADSVMISDIVMARRIESPPDNKKHGRDDLKILSNLDNRYFVGEPVWLYFEIYNLEKGESGRTSYVLKQSIQEKKATGLLAGFKGLVKSGSRKEISISYEGSSLDSDEDRTLMLDVSDLAPGDYTIILEITDKVRNETASAREDLVLYR